MLVIDDFQELLTTESFLRRLGFDVLSLGKDLLVNDALLRFSPDIVLASYRGRMVDGPKLALRLKKLVPPPRMALIYPAGSHPQLSADIQRVVDGLIEMPFQGAAVIKIVAQLAGLEPGPLLEKYERLVSAQAKAADSHRVGGGTVVGSTDSNKTWGGGSGAVNSSGDVFVKSADKNSNFETSSAAVGNFGQSANGWDPVKTPGKAAEIRTSRSDRYDQFLKGNDDGEVSGVIPKAKLEAASRKLQEDAQSEKETLQSQDEQKREFVRKLFTAKSDPDDSE